MANISITTNPTGRSPDNKFFFGKQTKALDLTRPKYNKIGKEKDYKEWEAKQITFEKMLAKNKKIDNLQLAKSNK